MDPARKDATPDLEVEVTTITVQAVYRKGALQPEKKLDLPENTLVQVQVTPLESVSSGFAALKGIWSHLSDQEIEQAAEEVKRARRRSRNKIKRLAASISDSARE